MEELVEFLSPATRLDLKVLALEHVLGMFLSFGLLLVFPCFDVIPQV